MIVDHHELGLFDNLRMVHAQRLQAEIDAVVVVVGRHADGQEPIEPPRGRLGNFEPLRRRRALGRRLSGESAGETGEGLRVDPGFERRADEMVEDSVERVGVAETQPDDRRSREKGERRGRKLRRAGESRLQRRGDRRLIAREIERLDRQRCAGRELDDDDETAGRPFLRRAPFGGGRDDQRIVAVGAGEIAERGELGERRRGGIGDDQRRRARRRARRRIRFPGTRSRGRSTKRLAPIGPRARGRRPARPCPPSPARRRATNRPSPPRPRSGAATRRAAPAARRASACSRRRAPARKLSNRRLRLRSRRQERRRRGRARVCRNRRAPARGSPARRRRRPIRRRKGRA